MSKFCDDELLHAIVEHRDQNSFEELYGRYHRAAYHLARFMTHDSELAEEAIQNTFLDVWHSAGAYKTGNVRSWILRIVAHKCANLSRSQKRYTRHVGRARETKGVPNQGMPADKLEKEELLESIRKCLQRLPDADRTLIALYYGGEVSQKRIGKEMDLPTRTVSFRLTKIIEELRAKLSQAGLASATSDLNADLISDALCHGLKIPESLEARIWENVSGDGLEALNSHSIGSSTKPAKAFLPLMAVAIFGMAVSGGRWWTGGPALSEKSPASQASNLGQTSELIGRWNFSNQPPKDFEVTHGEWHWVPAHAGKGGVLRAPPIGLGGGLLLPGKAPTRPFVVKVRICPIPGTKENIYFCLGFSDGDRLVASSAYDFATWTSRDPSWLRIYCTGRFAVAKYKDQYLTIWEYPKPFPSERLYLFAQNADLEEIVLEHLPSGKLPNGVRDPKTMVAGRPSIPAKYIPEFEDIPASPRLLDLRLSMPPPSYLPSGNNLPSPGGSDGQVRHYSFKSGVPEGIERIEKPENGEGVREAGSNRTLNPETDTKIERFLFSKDLPPGPLLVKIMGTNYKNLSLGLRVSRIKDGRTQSGRFWKFKDLEASRIRDALPKAAAPYIYILGRFDVVCPMRNSSFMVQERRYTTGRLCLTLKNVIPEYIEIHSLRVDEIPGPLRNIEELVRNGSLHYLGVRCNADRANPKYFNLKP